MTEETTAGDRIRLHRQAVERGARQRAAAARRDGVQEKRARGDRNPEGEAFFWEIVRDVLWAAGVAEIRAGYLAPRIVAVYPESLDGEALRPDQKCEILERAERVLSSGYRAGINWNHEPLRLLCTSMPVEVSLFG